MSQQHLDDFFEKLREDKRKLREIRYKRWKKQKIAIQKELELDEIKAKEREKLKEIEREQRRERIKQNMEKQKQRSL